MMKSSVLLLLALPALSSASLPEAVQTLDPVFVNLIASITANATSNQILLVIEMILRDYVSFKIDQSNLEWQPFEGSLPNGAVSIYNDHVRRTDYVCKHLCRAGFYNPSRGPHCLYPSGGKEHGGSKFEILVNKDNFEFLEWKEGSYGSVPDNSVNTCSNIEIYVGKNEFGLGKVDVINKAFYLPWEGEEHRYRTYQVLTFNTDVKSEHISDVKYKTDGVETIKYPPETMKTSVITNKACHEVTGTVKLEKTTQVAHNWGTSFSTTAGVTTSITAGIPEIVSVGIEISASITRELSEGTSYTESNAHSLSVEYKVPANHSCTVSMVGHKYSADIPYNAILSRTYRNGKTTQTSISGTYKGVQYGEVRAVVDRCEPLSGSRPCPRKK